MNPVALALKSQLSELARRKTGSQRWEELGNASVILPETAIPWGVAHFVGGAVLGQYPELCYDALLRPLADRAGIAVICTPYELGPDHGALAEEVSEAFETAFSLGAARYGWMPEKMPRIALGHSLGSKLQVLLRCRPGPPASPLYGLGLLAFNNFGVEDQVRLLKETLSTLQGGGGGGAANATADRLWESVLQPAIGRLARLNGLEFTPGPEELLDLVEESFGGAGRVRMFQFDDDSLDCSEELLAALGSRGAPGVSRETLPGGHLTPVVVSLKDVAQTAAGKAPGGMAGQVADRMGERFGGMGMGNGMGIGNQSELEAVLDSMVAWVAERS